MKTKNSKSSMMRHLVAGSLAVFLLFSGVIAQAEETEPAAGSSSSAEQINTGSSDLPETSSSEENGVDPASEDPAGTPAEEPAGPVTDPQEVETPTEEEIAADEPTIAPEEQEQSEEPEEPALTVQEETVKNGFLKEAGKTYYYRNDVKQTGQKNIDGFWYMFDPKTGAMVTGFYNHTDQTNPKGGPKTCYYDVKGHMVYGQRKIDGYWYMFHPSSGAMVKGFYNHTTQTNPNGGVKTCYYDAKGHMVYGQRKIDGYWYMFHPSSGAMIKGFYKHTTQTNPNGGPKTCYYDAKGHMIYGQRKIDGYWYMFYPSSGAMITGIYKHTKETNPIGGPKTCGYDSKGHMVYGQAKIGDDWYMFKEGSGDMITGWYYHTAKTNPKGGTKAVYYDTKTGKMLKGKNKIGKTTYFFNEGSGALQDVVTSDLSNGLSGYKIPYSQPIYNTRTIKNFLRTAFVACGRTYWVWGGGHGADSGIMGYPQRWQNFFVNKGPSYRATNDYMNWNGPDCSGYVSWVWRNACYTPSNHPGSLLADELPRYFSNKGWASYTTNKNAKYRPGDVVAMSTHVWICLGQYEDGSILLIHNSPQGVQLGGIGGEAKKRAEYYMAKYFPYWPHLAKNVNGYASRGHQHASWIPGKFLRDPEGIRNMHPDEVLKLFLGD